MHKEEFIIVALILLVIFSPYTAVLPLIYATYMVVCKNVSVYKNSWNNGLFFLFIWSMIVGILNHSVMSFVVSLMFFMYFCFSIFLQNYCDNKNKIEQIYRVVLHFSIFSAIFGIIEKGLFLFWEISIWEWLLEIIGQPVFYDRIYSTFGNPNVAGNWFGIMIILSLYFRDIANKKVKLFYSGTTVLFTIILFLTDSRGAYIGVIFGLVVYWFLKRDKKDIMLFILIFIIVAALTNLPENILNFNYGKTEESNSVSVSEIIEGTPESHEVDNSVNSRLGIWYCSLKMIKDKPITGWGITVFVEPPANYLDDEYYYDTLYHAHNIWITFAVTLGIAGLSIYFYMKLCLFKNLKILYQQNCGVVPMLAAIQALIIGHGIVDFTIIAPQTGLMFIACSAMITSLAAEYSKSTAKSAIFITKYKSLSKWS